MLSNGRHNTYPLMPENTIYFRHYLTDMMASHNSVHVWARLRARTRTEQWLRKSYQVLWRLQSPLFLLHKHNEWENKVALRDFINSGHLSHTKFAKNSGVSFPVPIKRQSLVLTHILFPRVMWCQGRYHNQNTDLTLCGAPILATKYCKRNLHKPALV